MSILYNFKEFKDERGSLVAIEGLKNIPFHIQRIYYIYGTAFDAKRGFHAHRNLEQIYICVSGSCKVLLDDGLSRKEFILNTPSSGLYIGPMVWREMIEFSDHCVLLVLASDFYKEEDYIRNYDEFIQTCSKDDTLGS